MGSPQYPAPVNVNPGKNYTPVELNTKTQINTGNVSPVVGAGIKAAMQTAGQTALKETKAAQQADASNRDVAANEMVSYNRRMGLNSQVVNPGGKGSGPGAGGVGGGSVPGSRPSGYGGEGADDGPAAGGGGSSKAAPLYDGKLTPDHDWSAFHDWFHPQPQSLATEHDADRATPAGLPFRADTDDEVKKFFDYYHTAGMQGAPYSPGQEADGPKGLAKAAQSVAGETNDALPEEGE